MITICRIVIYTLTAEDAERINRRRTDGASIAKRMNPDDELVAVKWPFGAQAHIGNTASEGQKFPAMVVAVHNEAEEAVNLQVFLDGNDVYWATSVHPDQTKQGAPGTWCWPAR